MQRVYIVVLVASLGLGSEGFAAQAQAELVVAAKPAKAKADKAAKKTRKTNEEKKAEKAERTARALAEQQFNAGELKYKSGAFEEALAHYTKAYETFPLPALLFNIAQCHRQMGKHERAVFFYEGYLREAPGAWNREEAEGLLAESRTAQEEYEAQQERQAETERLEAEAKAEAQEAARLAAEREAAEAAAAREQEAEFYEEWWFWTAIGSAVAVAAGATAITVVAVASQEPETVLPYGNMGTLDRRTQ